MNPPKYVQIDVGIYADNRVALMMRTHGAVGMGIYIYCLIEIGRQSNYPNMQICVDDIFIEAGAFTNGVEPETFKKVTDDLFRIGLLLKDDDGCAYSNGFNKRTGKDLLANYMRSVTQAGKPKQKTSVNEVVSDPEQPALEKKPKKSKSDPASDAETDASRAVKGYVASLEAEIGTKISCTMSNVEAEKIGAKYGELTPLAIRVYYLWKTAKGKRVKSDYLSMLAPWVLEKAQDLAKSMPLKAEPPKPAKTPEEIALGEERRKMIMERAGFGK
jgi:hypothetical protein